MRIQHNIAAMSSYRNYTTNTNALSKNLEKLSSGYKINLAGDDAAGLAISEKMRAQITGLNAAQKNVKDGISLVKTAEGAMQEIQDMLNRMDYLATQSANGTYDNEVDRLNLQKEVSALKDEINRIADSANFNGIKLLDGELDGGGASTRAQITLPDVGRPIGDATVLKDGGVTPGETVFDVQLDTLAVNAKAGDKLTVQIGEDEFELTLEEKQYSAGDLATALKDAFDAGAKTIDGQAFEATVNGTSVNFKQVNKPTSADDTVSAMMDVKISFEAAAGDGPVVLAAGDGGVDAGTPAAIEGTAKSDIAVGAKKLDASGLDTDKILAALNGKTIADGTKVTIEKNADDKLELKVGNEVIGTSDEVVDSNSTSFTIKSADGNTTFGTITADSAPATADFTAALETGLSYKAAVEGTDPGPDAPGGDGDGEETPEVETVASSKLSVNGIDLADKTVTLTTQNLTDIGDEFAKLGSNTGKILISGEVEVDLSKVTDGLTGGTSKVEDLAKNMLEAAKAGADAWNKANPDKDYTTAADRIKQAGIGMSNMDNSAFTIGNENDTGKLTIDEAAGQTVYTSELYTKDGFEALFSANSVSPKTGNGLTLQIGDTSDTYNQLKVSVGDMHTTALGIEGVDISNQAGASKAIQTIKDAINRVSSVRGDLGAVQNRLEHTQNNLSVMAENIQDAESTIRDTDAAEEMMSYVKNNILVQSAQAMLAQANQLPQGGDPSIPQETPGSVSTTPAEKPTEPTPPANEQAATLYIGTKAGGFAEYPITYEGELTAEKLIQGIADLTGWDLTLAEEITSGKGAEIPCRLSFLFF
jgi:flagellin